MLAWQNKLANLATQALQIELSLYPKAGLVSHVDNGSHHDMDAQTFTTSIMALEIYWLNMVQLGSTSAPFAALVNAGRSAEKQMLLATNGINTHRGAVFILGILIAALSYGYINKLPVDKVPEIILQLWGHEISLHGVIQDSHGSKVRDKYTHKAGDIIQDAATGFKPIINQYLPQLRNLYLQFGALGYLELFYIILATTADNNLLYRGGEAGLNWAHYQADQFLSDGGIAQADYIAKLESIHHEFVQHNLSPGGCADIFAATILVFLAEQELWD